MLLNDTWEAIEAFNDDNGTPLLVRYRPHLQNFVDSGIYLQRMDISWTYDAADASLMPYDDELALMDDVENALLDILEEEHQTILAFVFTGENERWWAWYTTNIDIAGERLNTALSEFDELPINITVTDDPDWDEYFGVMEDFG